MEPLAQAECIALHWASIHFADTGHEVLVRTEQGFGGFVLSCRACTEAGVQHRGDDFRLLSSLAKAWNVRHEHPHLWRHHRSLNDFNNVCFECNPIQESL